MDQNITPAPSSPPVVKKTNHNYLNLFLVLGIVLLIIIAAVLFWIYKQKTSSLFLKEESKSQTDSDPSQLSSNEFSGYIESVKADVLTVSENGDRKITYNIKVVPDTKIVISPPTIPYLTKLATVSASVNKQNDLKPGLRVAVVSKDKFGKSDAIYEAISITAVSVPTIIGGTINGVSPGALQVTVSPPAIPEEKKFTLRLDTDTEVVWSGMFEDSTKLARKTQLPFSTFKVGQEILIYTTDDISQSELKVQKIDITPPRPN